MKPFNVARRYGAKVVLLSAGVFGSVSAFAQAEENPLITILAAVGLTGVQAAVIAAMLIVIGIALAFKGGVLGKRVIRAV